MEVTVRQAKARLSRLLEVAQSGETVTIVRRGVPVARLEPLLRPARSLGWDKGTVPDSALQPLTGEEAEAFLSGR